MAYYLLTYEEVVDNYVEQRTRFREKHLELLDSARQRGELIMAGAFGEPIEGALLVFNVDDPSVVETIARNDPYVINGLVKRWSVKPWHVVVE
jgi:uncharacterized protein